MIPGNTCKRRIKNEAEVSNMSSTDSIGQRMRCFYIGIGILATLEDRSFSALATVSRLHALYISYSTLYPRWKNARKRANLSPHDFHVFFSFPIFFWVVGYTGEKFSAGKTKQPVLVNTGLRFAFYAEESCSGATEHHQMGSCQSTESVPPSGPAPAASKSQEAQRGTFN
jgi:hypothetical protein